MSRPRQFSADDEAIFRALWVSPTTPIESICKHFRMALATAHGLAQSYGLGVRPRMPPKPYFPPKDPGEKMRKCLGPCGAMFLSSHLGHRVCDGCKKHGAWKSGYAHIGGSTGTRIPARGGNA